MIDAGSPPVTYLKDYRAPDFAVERVDLAFVLDPARTIVTSTLRVRRRGDARKPLVLDGDNLSLKSVRVNGAQLEPGEYSLRPDHLSIPLRADEAEVEIVTEIDPSTNTQLMGLYMSDGIFCTQCEAEGFRRITYFPDRPDVMAAYTVRIEADKAKFPVLLSNGNLAEIGDLPGGRHWARWSDPFPKPSYLFALVAGPLEALSDRFVTRSGRTVALHIWVKPDNLDRTQHAMAALKKAMAWDESRFGLEYDLDIFNIVAVNDFNFGAMENKGLNVFNSKYVLAKPETATDADFDAIESVIAHEYFHNWSGNRVTCRDWFQLSLKEGLTVFRDQEFSSDVGSRGLKRIEDVRTLRAAQFPEDAGPLAHPVRPESYIEISNFYTATVYNKGAEVIRMLETLLGRDAFNAGLALYFQRHDGQAATCDDFIQAMADASSADLRQFRRWYSQAGTPVVAAHIDWDEATKRAVLTLEQSVPDTPGQTDKQTMLIPVRTALYGAVSGRELAAEQVLRLSEPEQGWTFEGVDERPIPSLLRGFSAPVILHSTRTHEDLATLARRDGDSFGRYEAAQQLFLGQMLAAVEQVASGLAVETPALMIDTIGSMITGNIEDPALVAEMILLPTEAYLGDQMPVVAVDAIHAVRTAMRKALSRALRDQWLHLHATLADPAYAFTAEAKARRRLRGIALQYLSAEPDPTVIELCRAQFDSADNMTDRIAAFTALVNIGGPAREATLRAFYDAWAKDPLVIDKWFAIQALAAQPDTLARVLALTRHPAYTLTNPNRVRALIGSFSVNQPCFHDANGTGYAMLADQILAVDGLNSQVAARLVAPLGRWKRFDAQRALKMRAQLERIVARPGLSRDVYEMVTKSLR